MLKEPRICTFIAVMVRFIKTESSEIHNLNTASYKYLNKTMKTEGLDTKIYNIYQIRPYNFVLLAGIYIRCSLNQKSIDIPIHFCAFIKGTVFYITDYFIKLYYSSVSQ